MPTITYYNNRRRESETKLTKPITGIRVLDFGILLAGPRGATLIGEFGAEVVKVEKPKIGDSLRGAAKNDEAGII